MCGESVCCCRSNCVIRFCVPNGIDLTVVVGEKRFNGHYVSVDKQVKLQILVYDQSNLLGFA